MLWTILVTAHATDTPRDQALTTVLGLDRAPQDYPYVAVTRDGPRVRGVVADVVPHDILHVLDEVVLCYSTYLEWFPYQTQARYISRTGDHGVIYGEVGLPWPIGKRHYELEVTGRETELTGLRSGVVSFAHRSGTGNIASLSGAWTLVELDADRTLVVYDATVDFDTFVPGFLLAAGTKHFLPEILAELGGRSQSCPADDLSKQVPRTLGSPGQSP